MFGKKIKAKRAGHPDYLIIFCVTALVIFGLVMLASASSNLGKIKFGDTYYYLKHQIFYGLSLGLIGFFLANKIYYRHYEKISLWLLIASIAALVLVFTPLGIHTKGAARWIAIGPLVFQPSEVLKITFIIYLAAWLGRKSERQKSFWKGFMPFLAVTALISGILLRQPATSTTGILIVTALTIYFVSGAKLSYIFGAFVAALAILAIVVYLTPYRLERIVNFIQPESDTERGGYHLNQALIAIGSGGLWGVGYGQSTTKISYLPEPIGDSIFAIAAEEFGFLGTSILIGIFFILTLKIFLLAKRHPDSFGRLMLVGFGTLIALQAFVHIGAISGIIPLTGTPLPFVSYGGTALAAFMTIGGIIVNISKYS